LQVETEVDTATTTVAEVGFGVEGMKLVVQNMVDTDMPELGLAGMRALKLLIDHSKACSEYETADLLIAVKDMQEEFSPSSSEDDKVHDGKKKVKGSQQFLYAASRLTEVLEGKKQPQWKADAAEDEAETTPAPEPAAEPVVEAKSESEPTA